VLRPTVILLNAISRADVPQLDAVVGRGGDQVPDATIEIKFKSLVKINRMGIDSGWVGRGYDES